MNPGPVPATSIGGRVVDYLFARLRDGIDFAPVIRDTGKDVTSFTGGPAGAIVFPSASVALERGLFLFQVEGPRYRESERIDPGELTVSVTIQVPRGRTSLVHYVDAATRLLTSADAILAGDPPIEVWCARRSGASSSESADFVLERIDHEFNFLRV